MSSPQQRYQQAITEGQWLADPEQALAMAQLERVYQSLLHRANPLSFWQRLRQRWFPSPPIQGLYLWGGVGIGKTFLMDLFFAALPFTRKRRLHFHEFMREVHEQLHRCQGQLNPLTLIAQRYAAKMDILCLDEFMVWDLADAMILARLFSALFERGVTLVTTSNCLPERLYPNGLQRALFLPAIALLQRHCQIHHLNIQRDYRQQKQQPQQRFFLTHTWQHQKAMRILFKQFSHGVSDRKPVLLIANRPLRARLASANCIWFDFKQLCAPPRSQRDYLSLSERFTYFFLTNVPRIAAHEHETARYLINLIDVLYDQQRQLIVSAAAPLEQLYPVTGLLAKEWQRTHSRLSEMLGETPVQLNPSLGTFCA